MSGACHVKHIEHLRGEKNAHSDGFNLSQPLGCNW